MRRPKDITGQRFGHLTALYNTGEKKSSFYVWHCVCDCGKEKDVPIGRLTSGNTTSCGYAKLKSHPKNIAGQTFDDLTAIEPTERRDHRSVISKLLLYSKYGGTNLVYFLGFKGNPA